MMEDMLSLGDACEGATVANAELSCTGRVSGLALHSRTGDEAVHGTRVMCTNTPANGITTMIAFNNK